ncbi:MAG: translation initiation factor IF-6 [Nanoarchaeota archaeon]|nr:translation initiation factor IF-6 [Nanoarchaeota archaeon]
MKFIRTDFNGDPNIGLYGFASDSYCLLGNHPKRAQKMEELLNVKISAAQIAGTELAGIFAAGNSNGILISKIADAREIKEIKKALGINVLVVKAKATAIGNLVVCNDKGCIISAKLKKYGKDIAEILDCETAVGKVAGLHIVGSAAVASNKGCLCHRDASEDELKEIEELLKVKADIGSIGGSPFVKAGIIANSGGVVVSEEASGPELQRIDEVFG